MKVYADTAFLVSFHIPDANSMKAIQRMRDCPISLPWSCLHRLEFGNALRQRIFRADLTDREVSLILRKVREKTQRGLYHEISFPDAVYPVAERLSALFTPKLGARSLDILHVAHAEVIGATDFLTFDHRQAALAASVGLTVPQL